MHIQVHGEVDFLGNDGLRSEPHVLILGVTVNKTSLGIDLCEHKVAPVATSDAGVCTSESDVSSLQSLLGAEIHCMAHIYEDEVEILILVGNCCLKV